MMINNPEIYFVQAGDGSSDRTSEFASTKSRPEDGSMLAWDFRPGSYYDTTIGSKHQ